MFLPCWLAGTRKACFVKSYLCKLKGHTNYVAKSTFLPYPALPECVSCGLMKSWVELYSQSKESLSFLDAASSVDSHYLSHPLTFFFHYLLKLILSASFCIFLARRTLLLSEDLRNSYHVLMVLDATEN